MSENSLDTPAAAPPTGILAELLNATPAVHTPPAAAVRTHRLDDSRPVRPGTAPKSPATPPAKPRDFTDADKAIIRKVHGYMAPMQLLGILNQRLICDIGDSASPYTLDQLRAEIASVVSAVPADGNDWGALRKLLAKARRAGVLEQIDEQVINDFAVVFSLNQKQVLTLKDIVLQPQEDES